MNRQEVAAILAMISSLDGRRAFGEVDVVAWDAVVGDLLFADARESVIRHYRKTTETLMPATLRNEVRAIRRERLGNLKPPISDRISPDDTRVLLQWERAWSRAICDGLDQEAALRAADESVFTPAIDIPQPPSSGAYDHERN